MAVFGMNRPSYFRKSHPWRLRLQERRTLLLVGDLLVALISLGLALLFWFSADRFPTSIIAFIQRRVPVWYFLFPVIWVILLVEIHDVHRAGNWRATIGGVAIATLSGFGLYLLLYFYYITPPFQLLPRRGVAGFFIAAPLLTLAWRAAYIRVFTHPQFMRRVLLVGGGKTGQAMLRVTNDLWPPPFYLVGIVDDDGCKLNTMIENHPVLGTSDMLLELVEEYNVSDIIVAINTELKSGMFQALLEVQERGVEIIRMPRAYEDLLGRVPIRLLEADWILRSFVDENQVRGFYEIAKRLVDVAGGLCGVFAFLVVLPFAALAIWLDDGLPIFYKQLRVGKGAQPYNIYKLRTMRRDAEMNGNPQWAREDDARATRTGRFLRRSHMDELPQFFNVVRGEMSLIGPRAERPELMGDFQRTVPFYRARLLVKPGITGWAQVNFGYAATVEETTIKLEYDLYYIKHRGLILDTIILLRTPATVFGFRGR
jgi:exopolysaccharide biosynthesis polyprenyl glycosylphosphotransferase